MKKVVFISSTGGHLTELLQLKPMFEKCEYTLITEKTKSNQNLIESVPGCSGCVPRIFYPSNPLLNALYNILLCISI